MKTELELQLWLAKQLPEEIEIHAFAKPWFEWKSERRGIIGVKVTPREWDYIVRRVEKKITDPKLRSEYCYQLSTESFRRCEACPLTGRWGVACASWQTRATALMKVFPENAK